MFHIQGGHAQIITFVIIIIVWIAIFYFITVVPQKKRKEKQQALFSDLKEGDVIVTIGGIRGEYAGDRDDQFIYIRVDKGVKLTVKRSAIGGRLPNNS